VKDATEQRIREDLLDLHQQLVRWGLVVWTAGNVSARIPDSELMLIKPSGVTYDALTADSMILCDLHGRPIDKDGPAPSSDASAHAYVYRNMPEVNGVVHTHSPYACAFSAVGRPIPCVLTGIADEFGGEIPVGPFARIGADDIGRGIVETLTGHRSRAVLMQNHGVFSIGPSAKAAVKAAVLCEDSARSVHLALALGTPVPITPEDIDALYDRYQNVYGQR